MKLAIALTQQLVVNLLLSEGTRNLALGNLALEPEPRMTEHFTESVLSTRAEEGT